MGFDLTKKALIAQVVVNQTTILFGKALDSGKEVQVVFCDISKAFDRVWHKGLQFTN